MARNDLHIRLDIDEDYFRELSERLNRPPPITERIRRVTEQVGAVAAGAAIAGSRLGGFIRQGIESAAQYERARAEIEWRRQPGELRPSLPPSPERGYRNWGEPWGYLPVEVTRWEVEDDFHTRSRTFTFTLYDNYRFAINIPEEQFILSRSEHIIDYVRSRLEQAIDGYRDKYLEKRDAISRAYQLLLSCLSPEQKQEFKANKNYFTVKAKSGKRYRIRAEEAYNVVSLDSKGNLFSHLCAGPPNVPVYDLMLAQKLWLENDEAGFLAVANRRNIIDFNF